MTFLAFNLSASALAGIAPQPSASEPYKEPLSVEDMSQVKALFKRLIEAENRHDLVTVKAPGLGFCLPRFSSPKRRRRQRETGQDFGELMW